jgi:hypothetical protein
VRNTSYITELDAEDEIIICCHHGARSYEGAQILMESEFPLVANLIGGVDAWSCLAAVGKSLRGGCSKGVGPLRGVTGPGFRGRPRGASPWESRVRSVFCTLLVDPSIPRYREGG